MPDREPITAFEFWERLEPLFRKLHLEKVVAFELRLRVDETPIITLEMIPSEEQAEAIVRALRHFVLVPREDA